MDGIANMNHDEIIEEIIAHFPGHGINEVRRGFYGSSDEEILESLRELQDREDRKVKITTVDVTFAKILVNFGYDGLLDAFKAYSTEVLGDRKRHIKLSWVDFEHIIYACDYLKAIDEIRRDEVVMAAPESTSKKTAAAKNRVINKLTKSIPKVEDVLGGK